GRHAQSALDVAIHVHDTESVIERGVLELTEELVRDVLHALEVVDHRAGLVEDPVEIGLRVSFASTELRTTNLMNVPRRRHAGGVREVVHPELNFLARLELLRGCDRHGGDDAVALDLALTQGGADEETEIGVGRTGGVREA